MRTEGFTKPRKNEKSIGNQFSDTVRKRTKKGASVLLTENELVAVDWKSAPQSLRDLYATFRVPVAPSFAPVAAVAVRTYRHYFFRTTLTFW